MESKRLNCRTQVNVDGAIELCLRKADVNKDGKKEGAIELSNDRDGLVGFFFRCFSIQLRSSATI